VPNLWGVLFNATSRLKHLAVWFDLNKGQLVARDPSMKHGRE